MHFQTDI